MSSASSSSFSSSFEDDYAFVLLSLAQLSIHDTSSATSHFTASTTTASSTTVVITAATTHSAATAAKKTVFEDDLSQLISRLETLSLVHEPMDLDDPNEMDIYETWQCDDPMMVDETWESDDFTEIDETSQCDDPMEVDLRFDPHCRHGDAINKRSHSLIVPTQLKNNKRQRRA